AASERAAVARRAHVEWRDRDGRHSGDQPGAGAARGLYQASARAQSGARRHRRTRARRFVDPRTRRGRRAREPGAADSRFARAPPVPTRLGPRLMSWRAARDDRKGAHVLFAPADHHMRARAEAAPPPAEIEIAEFAANEEEIAPITLEAADTADHAAEEAALLA